MWKRELALLKQRPRASGADGVEGPGSALPQFSASFVERCQGLERKERELHWAFAWASGMPSLAAEELSALFLLISLLRRWHAEGWVSGNRREAAEGIPPAGSRIHGRDRWRNWEAFNRTV